MSSLTLAFAPQIDEALQLSTREWTIGALALFLLFVSWIVFYFVVRKIMALWREDVGKLVTRLSENEDGWRKDLQDQLKKRGEDAERVERGLADAAGAVRDQTRGLEVHGARIEAAERRLEDLQKSATQILSAVQRRGGREE